MSSRGLLLGIFTIGVAVTIISLWIGAVGPMLAPLGASGRPPHTTSMPSVSTVASNAAVDSSRRPAPDLLSLVGATMLLAFILLCLLLAITLIATMREMLVGSQTKKSTKTTYVDAWKLAGKRLTEKPPEDFP